MNAGWSMQMFEQPCGETKRVSSVACELDFNKCVVLRCHSDDEHV